MISKIVHYIFPIILGVAVMACSDDTLNSDTGLVAGSPGTITIQFKNSERSLTTRDNSRRSRAEGNDADNPYEGNTDFLIENLFIAFFPFEASEETPALMVTKALDLSEYGSHTLTLELNREMVRNIFGSEASASCRIYALANIREENITELGDNPSITDMKNLSITTDFLSQKQPESFVMAGEGKVEYTKGSTEIDPGYAIGECKLYRAAARIMLNLHLPTSIKPQGSDSEWEPVAGQIKCLLINGVKDAVTSPVPSSEEVVGWRPTTESAYFNGTLVDENDQHNGYRIFEYTPPVNDDNNDDKEEYPYSLDVPFYTYPNTWQETPDESHKTVMTLIVPWKLKGSADETRRNYYYQVPVTPTELNHIDRNYSYTVNLKVGMLGSLDPDIPLPTEEFSYQVVNWSQTNIDVEMNEYRYLVVNPNVYVMNNVTDIEIPFYTSHPVSLSDVSITYERFNFVSNGSNPNVGRVISVNIDEEQIEKTNNNTYENPEKEQILDVHTEVNQSNQNIIVLHHPLTLWDPRADYGEPDEDEDDYTDADRYAIVSLTGRTSGSSEASFNAEVTRVTNLIKFYTPTTYPAYSPYVIRLHIEHSDNSNFAEDITITQYPAMYIQADRNPNTYLPTSTTPPPYGNVFVNGVWSSREAENEDNYYDLGNIRGISSNAQNQNPNMYVITTTQLSLGSEYVIGDPRSLYYTNDLSEKENLNPIKNGDPAGDWCTPAESMYPEDDEKRTLSYYYPTIETSSTENMIAPKLRIASSWGIGSLAEELYQDDEVMERTRVMSRRRAATYQEQGYPAGRWRLPTLAEFKYIVQLSIDKKIPELYTSGNQIYWTAQGAYYISDDEGDAGKILPAPPPKIGTRRSYYNIRPVYDEWYWEQFPQYKLNPYSTDPIKRYNYTLGDVPRGQ